MRYFFLLAFAVSASLSSCDKNSGNNQVDIYLLKSFTTTFDTMYYPAATVIGNAVPEETPLIANNEIRGYNQADNSFIIYKNINDRVKNLPPGKAFAVMVNSQPVYYGVVHHGILSSLRFGIATIDPIITNTQLLMRYNNTTLRSGSMASQLDKRNDTRLLEAFRSTGRLR